MASRHDAKIDAKIQAKINAKIQAKIEAKIEAKIGAKIGAKIEAKIDAKTDAKTERKANTGRRHAHSAWLANLQGKSAKYRFFGGRDSPRCWSSHLWWVIASKRRVRKLILLQGKTTTTEFTVTNSGPETTNPHDPNRTPGGSSCGSAAAVADLQVPLSLGSQTGGSIIRPASFTGLFALKPTHDSISPEGQKAVAPAFDTFGFFGRSMEDLQLLADVFALKDDMPPRDIPKEEITVAMIKTPMWSRAGPGTVSAMKDAATILQNNGIRVEEVSFPSEIEDAGVLKQIQTVLILGQAQTTFLREYRLDKKSLAAEICDIVENKFNSTHEERVHASDTYARMRRIINDLAANYSAILTPSAIDEAPLGLDSMGSATFNTMWTVSVKWDPISPRAWALTSSRDFICRSSTFRPLSEPMECPSACLSWAPDTTINSF